MHKLKPFPDQVYCVSRIVLGLMFACHGGTKVLGFPASPYRPATNTLRLVTGWIELICGVLVAFGLLIRLGAFFASGEMAVAYFMTAARRGFFPIANGGEMAVAYCFMFLYMVLYGSGRWSVDFALKRKPAERTQE